MTYKRFEDLPVWLEAIRLAELRYELTEDAAFKGQYSLRINWNGLLSRFQTTWPKDLSEEPLRNC